MLQNDEQSHSNNTAIKNNISSIVTKSSVVRLAGDSGDGMQLVGDMFTNTCALDGDFFATLPDYPSEIRAPAGTLFGVSGFQVCAGKDPILTPGDYYDTLIAMNPAALKVNLPQVKPNGFVIVNEDAFIARNWEKATYTSNPLEQTESFSKVQLVKIKMTENTKLLLAELGLSNREAERSKNFYAMGVLLWLYNKSTLATQKWIQKKFASKPEILKANLLALDGGYNYGPTYGNIKHRWIFSDTVTKKVPGTYRNISGNQAIAMGLMAAAQRANLRLFLGSYPITPATDIMHELAKYPDQATILQAEDEIAGIGSAIGAAFGGALAVTTTSGPGFSLKSEFMNLAVMTELPLVIVDVQRAGPSTGIPTKTEQSDLLQALFGRHGESPLVVMASSSPKDCFDCTIEASRIALKYMTPVVLLSEGYLGNGSEVWKVPDLDSLPSFPAQFAKDPVTYQPYKRDPQTLARPWAIPGTPGLEHRLGGLEKLDGPGTVSQDGLNHERMTYLRAEKVARVAQDIPALEIHGEASADLLVLGWGGTEGAIKQAVTNLNQSGHKVASTHLRYLNPLPKDLESTLKKYKKVLIPELNSGQLWFKIRGEYLIQADKLSKVQGQPFLISEIENKILSLLGER